MCTAHLLVNGERQNITAYLVTELLINSLASVFITFLLDKLYKTVEY